MTTPETTPELSAQVTEAAAGPAAWRALAREVRLRVDDISADHERQAGSEDLHAFADAADALCAAAAVVEGSETAGNVVKLLGAFNAIKRENAALRAAVEAQEVAIRRLADELETRDAEAERRAYFGPARAPLYGVTPDLHQPDPAAGRAAHSPTEGL